MDGKYGLDDLNWQSQGGTDDPAENRLKPVRRSKRSSIPSIIIASLLVICSLAGVVVLWMTGLLPTGWLIAAVAADLVITAVTAILLLVSRPCSHPVRFICSTILAVVVMVVNIGVVKMGSDYINFGHGIQAPPTDTVLYDIVVLDPGPSDITALKGTPMGEVSGDNLSQAVHAKVATLVDVTYQPSDTWNDLITALTSKDVSSIVIFDGYMQILEDADPTTFGTLTVLTSFEIDSSLAQTPGATSSPSASPTPVPAGGAYVLYISGIDTYGAVSTRSRSDVNMLMVVNPSTGKILLVNTPRDFYVQLRGKTGLKDKLTHAGIYGIDVSIGTMEDLYNTTIDYYVRINFSSLVTVIDALGGVDVDSAYDFSAQGFTFVKGMNHLTGAAALAFSRDRHDFAEGDRIRGENQQRVIEGIIHKITQPSVLLNYTSILSAIQSSMQTSMPQDVISAQVRQQLATNESWSVNSISVNGSDGLDYTYSYPNQRLYVMIPDQSTVATAIAQIDATLQGQ